MRYSLLAGGKRIRPVLALATARSIGPRSRARPARRGGDRADPHLLADPRRPAGDGRRRAPARDAHLARQVRRERRHPRRRRPLRRGDAACSPSARRASPARFWRRFGELVTATGVGGMVGGQYVDVTEFEEAAPGDWGRRSTPSSPAGDAFPQDRAVDRIQRGRRIGIG